MALARTDIADHALERLRQSKVREVVVLGRRGPAQASFTTPELRELGRLEGVDVVVDPRNLELDPASRAAMEEDRTARANLKILQDYAARPGGAARRRIILRFLASPVEIIGADGRIAVSRSSDGPSGAPTGLIGNNKPDAAATVEAMLADLPLLRTRADGHRDLSAIEVLLRERGTDVVTLRDWQILDRYEVAAGHAQGRPRIKVTTVPEMLAVIHAGR